MTSDATQTDSVGITTEVDPYELRSLIRRTRVVLWDFDGPICRLFAGHSAERVAHDLASWLEGRGLQGVLTEAERDSLDPHVMLRAVGHRYPGSDLAVELEERLTQLELQAATTAMPTAYADPLIRTWTAVGVRLAVASNNSPRAIRQYLTSRGLFPCFAPHVYGRTGDLQLLKPDPHCLNRALSATGAAPSSALMIGDTPTDFLAAKKAGVPFLGYARNGRTLASLRDAGAEVVLSSLEPLLKLLRS